MNLELITRSIASLDTFQMLKTNLYFDISNDFWVIAMRGDSCQILQNYSKQASFL